SHQALSDDFADKCEEPTLSMCHWPAVVVATPAHSGMGDTLSYRSERALAPGTLGRVLLGAREVLGIVWGDDGAPPEVLAEGQAREAAQGRDAPPPVAEAWRELVGFAAPYCRRALGAVALAALPPPLGDRGPTQLARRPKRPARAEPAAVAPDSARALTPEQA